MTEIWSDKTLVTFDQAHVWHPSGGALLALTPVLNRMLKGVD